MEVSLALSSAPTPDVIDRAAAGDRDAFATLVTPHHSNLLRVAYVILGDASLAEDAAQAAWVKAWLKLRDVRDHTKLRPRLISVVANEARQLIRRRRRQGTGGDPTTYGAEADPGLVDLAVVLDRLSINDRQLVALRYGLDMPSAEIGAILGISSGAVRSRVMRVLGRLRAELDRE
jgi:RNA polymerase sigma factor (sigma-70 family)